MNKAVFLDKDGTLINDIPYNVDPDKIGFARGVHSSIGLLAQRGFLLIVVTNQSGVAKGLFNETALDAVWKKLQQEAVQAGASFTDFYFCPHHPCGNVDKYKINCSCRKPRPGMLLQAISEYNIDPASSWMIGDILNDIEAGKRAGCSSILINNGNETEWVRGEHRNPDYTASDFADAVQFILNRLDDGKHESGNRLQYDHTTVPSKEHSGYR